MARLILGIAISFLLLVCLSCKKEKPEPKFYYSAMVLDEGPVITDGCGWHIIVFYDFGAATDYIPANLPSSFEIDSLPVTVSFTVPGDSIGCGIAFTKFPAMNIDSIK